MIYEARNAMPTKNVPALWYRIRKKIGDMKGDLPAGTQGPFFNDEFGDTYGNIYALTGDGFDYATLKRYAEASPAVATALNPQLGYETTAAIMKESSRTGKSVRQIVLARKLMTDEQLDRALDVEAMTRGGIIG